LSSKSYEIVVVGGGAAGLSCALAAAAAGGNVLLLEQSRVLGGTVRQALIHTIGGLFDEQGDFLNPGLPVALTGRLERACSYTQKRRIGKTWVLNCEPEVYAAVITDWIEQTPNITVRYEAEVRDIAFTAARVAELQIAEGERCYTVQPRALVDATGNASIVRHIDAALVQAGEALGGYIVQLCGLEADALQFPRGVAVLRQIRKAVAQGELPPECATAWLDTGVYAREAYAKFSVAPDTFDEARMRVVADRLLAFLQVLPGFANAFIHRYGQIGVRDGGRVKGVYCLTEQDVKTGRRFDDSACRAAWPIEHWHPQQGLSLEYLPPGHSYEIPLRCFQVQGFRNLWAVGKCLSAEPRAQASARVLGTCWAMGAAVGKHLVGSKQ
jgi:hypothetical protein